jgi:hypothetical protein
MTSPRQIKSNQANARQSTGPRSREGKARSSCNALRHGLAAPVTLDDDTARQIASLARSLVGDQAHDSPIRIYAQRLAEAELDLVRIRQARAQAWNQQAAEWTNPSGRRLPDERAIQAYKALCSLLARVDRYERRALSRRRTAIRALNEVRVITGGEGGGYNSGLDLLVIRKGCFRSGSGSSNEARLVPDLYS